MEFVRTKLIVRLLLYFLLLSIIPLGIVGYMSYESGQESMVDQVKSHLESVAIIKEQEIDNWITHLSHTTDWLTNDTDVRADVTILTTHPVDAPAYLAAHQSLNEAFRGITNLNDLSPTMLIDNKTGEVIASSDGDWEGKLKGNEPYFINGRNGIYVSDIYHSLSLGQPTMVIAAPVKDDNGQLAGVIACHANMDILSEIMLEWTGLGETGETFLVNKYNLLITDTVFAPDGAFNKWIFGDGATWALEGRNGSGEFVDYRGKPVVGAYRWIENRELALIAKQDRAEALSSVTDLRNLIIGVTIGVALIIILFSVMLGRTVTRPLHRLVDGAREVGRGNLDYQLKEQGRDEIGLLTVSFNIMVQNLKETTSSRDELDKEVGERKLAEEKLEEAMSTLSNILQTVPIGISVSTPDGQIIESNSTTVQIFGYDSRDEFMSQKAERYYYDAGDRERFIELLRNQGYVRGFEIQLKRKDGTVFCGSVSSVKQTGQDGSVQFVNSFIDITERKQAELSLMEIQTNISDLIENSIDGILIADATGKHIFSNNRMCEITGYEYDEFMDMTIKEMTPPEDLKKYKEMYDKRLRGEEVPNHYERPIIRKDGRIILVELRTTTTIWKGEKCALAFMTDITERKKTEGELIRTMEDLERSNRELEQFAYVVSHDLQEPLRMVASYVQLLEKRYKDQLDQDANDFINFATDGAIRMQLMINDILEYSRVGTKGREFKSINLNSVLSKALANLESQIQEHGAIITGDDLPQVFVDEIQMVQLFQNLIGNAIKFRGEEIPRILITATEDNFEWVISIKDNGIGIPQEFRDKIFSVFRKLHAIGQYPGSGIGLAIAAKIVERHSGRIWVESEPGEGSTFYFAIPKIGR